jgi:tetratricopeptide (TPR) repeat protein
MDEMSDTKILENLARKGREALRFLETDTALAIFKDILEIDENYIDGLVGQGQAYYEVGKLKDSEKAFKKALKLAEKENKNWRKKNLSWKTEKNRPVIRLVHGLGLLEFRKNNIKAAKKWFELESQLDPSLEAPLAMLADIEQGKKFSKLKYQKLSI